MKTKHYIMPECDEVLLVSESSVMTGSQIGVSIDDFASDDTDYTGGWQIIN